jgi:hypothetical protein
MIGMLDGYLRRMKRSTRILLFTLFVLSLFIVLLGALAKIQHWPIANVLLPIGMLAQFCSIVSVVAMLVFTRKAR